MKVFGLKDIEIRASKHRRISWFGIAIYVATLLVIGIVAAVILTPADEYFPIGWVLGLAMGLVGMYGLQTIQRDELESHTARAEAKATAKAIKADIKIVVSPIAECYAPRLWFMSLHHRVLVDALRQLVIRNLVKQHKWTEDDAEVEVFLSVLMKRKWFRLEKQLLAHHGLENYAEHLTAEVQARYVEAQRKHSIWRFR